MTTMTLPIETQRTLSDLSSRMHIPEIEILQQAVNEFAENIRKKQRVMSFAGMLTEDEAEELLRTIRTNRLDKITESDV